MRRSRASDGNVLKGKVVKECSNPDWINNCCFGGKWFSVSGGRYAWTSFIPISNSLSFEIGSSISWNDACVCPMSSLSISCTLSRGYFGWICKCSGQASNACLASLDGRCVSLCDWKHLGIYLMSILDISYNPRCSLTWNTASMCLVSSSKFL